MDLDYDRFDLAQVKPGIFFFFLGGFISSCLETTDAPSYFAEVQIFHLYGLGVNAPHSDAVNFLV